MNNTKPRKRGRKPKGGKILSKVNNSTTKREPLENNVILHLKIDTEKENLDIPEFFNINNIKTQDLMNDLSFKNEINDAVSNSKTNMVTQSNTSQKDLWDKLNNLKRQFQRNNTVDKRCSCFWDTCPFDNPPIYIPKQEVNGTIEVYGCFCSPECATAYLKNENLDSSTLWERYALLNTIYSKIYNYKDNIKPAPNPHYTLDKFYGNLTIEEYRQLLGKQHFLVVVERPLTKIMPEIHDDISDLPNIYNNLLTKNNNKDLCLTRNSNRTNNLFK